MSAATLRVQIESSLGERLSSTLLLRERAVPLTVATGIDAVDRLTGGLPRGALSEIAGGASSGRTGVMMAALAQATRRQEICALVDASDSFDPASAAAAAIDLDRLLWVRCNEATQTHKQRRQPEKTARRTLQLSTTFVSRGRLEQVLKVTDLLLQSGGLGMVVLDMGDIPPESTRRIPLTWWFRFRRAVEPTATVLLLIEQQASASTCASLVVRLERRSITIRNCQGLSEHRQMPAFPRNAAATSHGALLRQMGLHAEVARSWMQRKPPQSAGIGFELRTAL